MTIEQELAQALSYLMNSERNMHNIHPNLRSIQKELFLFGSFRMIYLFLGFQSIVTLILLSYEVATKKLSIDSLIYPILGSIVILIILGLFYIRFRTLAPHAYNSLKIIVIVTFAVLIMSTLSMIVAWGLHAKEHRDATFTTLFLLHLISLLLVGVPIYKVFRKSPILRAYLTEFYAFVTAPKLGISSYGPHGSVVRESVRREINEQYKPELQKRISPPFAGIQLAPSRQHSGQRRNSVSFERPSSDYESETTTTTLKSNDDDLRFPEFSSPF